MLGQVVEINDRDIGLALPNNLTGYAPLTSISPVVTRKIESLLANDGNEERRLENSLSHYLNLRNYVRLGQFLRAYVVSTTESQKGDAGSKRHIELSIDPSLTNSTLSEIDCVENTTIQASVESFEDHGIVLNLGLRNPEIKGFLPVKSAEQNNLQQLEEGSVLLCTILKSLLQSNTIKLKAHLGNTQMDKLASFSAPPPSGAFLPGTAADMQIVDLIENGIKGKLPGGIDVTADFIHSGLGSDGATCLEKLKIGKTTVVRITFEANDHDKKMFGVSLLPHVLHMVLPAVNTERGPANPAETLPISSFVESAKVVGVDPSKGLSLGLGVVNIPGYCHISRISDSRIKSISQASSKYRIGTIHRSRVISFNAIDCVYYMSMEESILERKYLTVDEVKPGEKVIASVEKLLIDENGFKGLRLKITENISGVVSLMHIADVDFQHPEQKYREGQKVTARILTVHPRTKRVTLTLKKTLVNIEDKSWRDYRQINIGDRSRGTLTKILKTGAVVNFFGQINAFLPKSEMSEAFIDEPAKHFRVGQTLDVKVLSILPEERNMIVSCIMSSAKDEKLWKYFESIETGMLVNGTVLQKTEKALVINLKQSGLIGILSLDDLSDGTVQKNGGLFRSIRIGQCLNNLLIYHKFDKKPMVKLSSRSSLVKQAQKNQLITKYSELQQGHTVHGVVKNVTEKGIFINIPGNLTGLLPALHISKDLMHLPSFGFRIGQAISATVLALDTEQQKFLLSMRQVAKKVESGPDGKPDTIEHHVPLVDPVDPDCKSIRDYSFGRNTKARIIAVKETQLNVALASGVQGRIDASEIFDNWEDIKDRKYPLKAFRPKQILPVKIIGMHDAKTHRYLPISHRNATMSLFELTAKVNRDLKNAADLLSLEKIVVGSSWVGFVNNITDRAVWINLSPNVRGRIDLMDLSDDISRLENINEAFPVGSAIKLKVKNVNINANHLDLSARKSTDSAVSLETLRPGSILPGRITKVTENKILVQLSDIVVGSITLTEIADDYTLASPAAYSKNDVVRVCVVGVDLPNKRVYLSLRPSKVLNSNSAVADPHIGFIEQLRETMVLRGFVKNVSEKGVFISLGPTITAFVRICDLSDKYIKDWKTAFPVDKLVKGRVINIDYSVHHVQISLKESVVDENYVPPITFNDIKPQQLRTGTIRKVEDYGVFIVVDNSTNVSGLCHRSEIADRKVEDVKKLFSEGDRVKAKVLKVENETKRISFGLKASYFKNGIGTSLELMDGNSDGVALASVRDKMDIDEPGLKQSSEGEEESGGVKLKSQLSGSSSSIQPLQMLTNHREDNVNFLEVNGFDWTGEALEENNGGFENSDIYSEEAISKEKKRRRKSQIPVDKTGDLDSYGPQSDADFERQLLAEPNSSSLWVHYMAFQLQCSEIDKARQIAERALRTIHIREVEEKQNVWIALLNLENAFGSNDTMDSVFKRACQYNDPGEMHEKFASILIESDKFEVHKSQISRLLDGFYH